MVECACGKPLEKVPAWLSGTTISFVCNNCPNRTVKAITQVVLEIPKEAEPDEMKAIGEAVGDDADDDDLS